MQPSSGHAAPPPTAAHWDPRPQPPSFLRQLERGWGIFGSWARAACPGRKGPGSCPALGGRKAERGNSPAGHSGCVAE